MRTHIRAAVLPLMIFILVTALSPAEAKAATDCNSVTEIPVAECEALVALYNSTNGSNWGYQGDWTVTNTPCSWYGVSCTPGTTSRHVTSINIYDNQLNGAIPPEFGNLSSLQSLNLSNNQLTSLPAEIGKLTNLLYLDISFNQLSSVPPEIGNLINLRSLSLYVNRLTSVPAEIGNLSNLQHLVLINNQLSSIPPEIGNLSSLQHLELSNNQLSSLPAEIGNLMNLEQLWLNNNQLTSLPPEFGNLTKLRLLSLGNNQLSSLPPEFGNLTNLLEVWIYSNQLSSLPPEIGKLTKLRNLALNNNRLSSLPPEIGNMSHLGQLALGNNQLTSLPPEIGKLPILGRLELFSNQLSSLPPEIGNLTNLGVLYLSSNRLNSLPAEIGKLRNLRQLALGFNQLSSLPAEFINLSGLVELHLHRNPSLAGPLPANLVRLTRLQLFHFHDTKLCEPGDATFQSWLANIRDLHRTNVICTGGTGKVTIFQDTQPNSVQDFRYSGDLGSFRLDNAIPNDNDGVSRQKTFQLDPGVYTVHQQVPGNWLLTDVACTAGGNAAINPANNQVMIGHPGGSDITCTFINQRKSIVRIVAYKDSNGDAQQNKGERALNQWQTWLYDAEGTRITNDNNLTNGQGKQSYAGLRPGEYKVCIELRDSWVNTQPGLINSTFQLPCYSLTVGPGQIAQVSFGNADWPVTSAAQPSTSGGVVIFDMPDVEVTDENYAAVDTDEAWLNAPLQAPGLFMPLIEAEE